jgi:REP element-mobilizing transposase RayT
MARPPRAFRDGIFHLYVHASDTRFLFITDDDRVIFLVMLTTVFGHYELCPIAYTLMGNHYHLILYAPDERISDAMQQLHTFYSRAHNKRHERSAHLFRAHFGAREITSARQLLAAARYIARNPVEAGLVADPLDWPWGSARTHAGVAEAAMPLDEDRLSAAFDGTEDWRRRYRRLVSE